MNTLVEYFGTAFLINLPHRADRLESAKKELERVEWHIGPLGVKLFQARKFSELAGFSSVGVRGAFHSHWECLRRAYAEGCRNVMILEDDIAFSPALVRLTPSIISLLKAEVWDFVFFGHSQTGMISDASSMTSPDKFAFSVWNGEIQGLHFYAVNERIIPRVVTHLERVANGNCGDQEFGPMPIDGALNNFRRFNPDVKTLIASPKLGWQRPSRSDISPSKIDKLRFLRPLTTMFRNIKDMTDARRS